MLDFRNCLLVEQPNGDFAQTIARQSLFSTWQELLFEGLCGSTDATLAAVAAKAVKEVAYHARFACEWVVRLGDGTDESRRRMIAGLDWMWRFTGELFEADAVVGRAGRRGRRGRSGRPARAVGSRASTPCWPTRAWSARPTAAPSSAGARGAIPNTWAICCRRCSSCSAPIRGRCGEQRSAVRTQRTRCERDRRVFEILSHVPDPEIPAVSVVDLGIVRGVRDGAVAITPTYTGCPATLAIEAAIRKALDEAGLGGVADASPS